MNNEKPRADRPPPAATHVDSSGNYWQATGRTASEWPWGPTYNRWNAKDGRWSKISSKRGWHGQLTRL